MTTIDDVQSPADEERRKLLKSATRRRGQSGAGRREPARDRVARHGNPGMNPIARAEPA